MTDALMMPHWSSPNTPRSTPSPLTFGDAPAVFWCCVTCFSVETSLIAAVQAVLAASVYFPLATEAEAVGGCWDVVGGGGEEREMKDGRLRHWLPTLKLKHNSDLA